jgi:hypothetical protein
MLIEKLIRVNLIWGMVADIQVSTLLSSLLLSKNIDIKI